MKSITSIYNEIQQYTERYSWAEGSNLLLLTEREYFLNGLNDLLKIDGYEQNDIDSLISYKILSSIKPLANEVAEQHFLKNLSIISKLTGDVQYSPSDIMKHSEHYVQAYYDTRDMIKSLTYEEMNALELFELFIKNYNIKFENCNKMVRFKCKFSEASYTDKTHRWYCFKTLTGFFDICKEYMIDNLCNEYRNFEFDNKRMYIPATYDSDLLSKKDRSKLSNDLLYSYLSKLPVVRVNTNLEFIFLLLSYQNFEVFSDVDAMDILLKNIEKTKRSSRYRQASKKGYNPVAFSIEEIIEEIELLKHIK